MIIFNSPKTKTWRVGVVTICWRRLFTVLTAAGAALVASAQSGPVAYSFTTLVGTPHIGSEDGLTTAARFNQPFGIAIDAAGNLYVADTGNQLIRKITADGVVTTLAGVAGETGAEDGPGATARFNDPIGIAVDRQGNVYVADAGNGTVRKITAVGLVSTLAGSAGLKSTVDGAGAAARFRDPVGIAVDATGTVFVVDEGDHVVRKITPEGVVTTFAGKAGEPGSANGAGAAARFSSPGNIVVDAAGNLYVGSNGLRKITPAGVVSTVAATGLRGPDGIAVDGAGNFFVTSRSDYVVQRVSTAGVVTTVAGAAVAPGSADGTGAGARFREPTGVAVDTAGNLFVVDQSDATVRKITPAGVVTTFAGRPLGGGSVGSSDGTGRAARFNYPAGIAVDSAGNLVVADFVNQTIRKITATGVTTTLAGGVGVQGSINGTGAAARFSYPYGVAVDAAGNVYVSESGNATIRKITPAGVVTTLAGSAGNQGDTDGSGAVARFRDPQGLAIDAGGNLYLGDSGRVRKISPTGVVTTLAGSNEAPFESRDGTGSGARFGAIDGVAVDRAGNVFVCDKGNGFGTVRKITPAGVVSTLAGFATAGGMGGEQSSSDGTGPTASFSYTTGIAVDAAGNLFVGDGNQLRMVSPTGVVRTIAGLSSGSADATGGTARFNGIRGVAVDAAGAVYVTDEGNNTIRKGVPSTTPLAVRMGNLSVRTTAGSGAQTLTVGFVVADGQKSLLIRGIGPALAQFGLTGVLADPQLGLYSGATLAASNNDWGSATNAAQVVSVAATLGGFALPVGSKDAALFTTLGAGAYTAQLSGADGGTGVALVELYDADAAASARFFNASARAQVGSGAGILIAGFSVAGNTPKTVLVRGVGPTLGGFGVPDVLADPQLAIFRGPTQIAQNDNWAEGGTAGQVAAAAAQVGAFPLASGSKDAVLLLSLRPGSYTAQISGTGGTTGVALVEVYEVP